VRDESGKPFLTTRVTHRERCEAVLAGEPPGRVTIIRRHGFAAEKLEVDVISVQHTGWGNYQLEGRLVSDSSYQPYQRAGSLIQFDPSIIVSW